MVSHSITLYVPVFLPSFTCNTVSSTVILSSQLSVIIHLTLSSPQDFALSSIPKWVDETFESGADVALVLLDSAFELEAYFSCGADAFLEFSFCLCHRVCKCRDLATKNIFAHFSLVLLYYSAMYFHAMFMLALITISTVSILGKESTYSDPGSRVAI